MPRSTFYHYCQLLPLKVLIETSLLTKRECFQALDVYNALLKTTDEKLLKSALQKVSFSPLFKADLTSFVNDMQGYKAQINDVLIRNYDCASYNGCYLPILQKASASPSTEIKLLSFAVWSVAVSNQEKLDKIIAFSTNQEDRLYFLKNVKSRFSLLPLLIDRLTKELPLAASYQATELLITTNTKFKPLALSLLQGGWE